MPVDKVLQSLDPNRLRPVRLLLLDVDGVMTDGRITYSASGDELKSFHVRDGSGLKYWHRSGGRTAILTGRKSSVVERRAAELGIEIVRQGALDKGPVFDEILDSLAGSGITPAEVACVGDDLPDLPPMRRAGLAIAVADAAAEVKEFAAAVTKTEGGRGAVREVVEAVLRAQGRWEAILARYR